MRKIKPKMTKKEREITKVNNFINEKCKPIYNAGLILSVFVEYLQEHRNLFDNKECYLKPYLKGILTSTINKVKNFIEYNYIKENLNGFENCNRIKKITEKYYDEELKFDVLGKEFKAKKISDINYRIFKTYACALICLGTVNDMFITKEKDPIYNDFKERLKKSLIEFNIYNDFWQKEIHEMKVKLI